MAKMTLDELVTQLRAALSDELRAIVLYGSAAGATGDHVPKRSDYNVLVIVNAFAPGRLSAASAAVRAWTDAGNTSPLLLTDAEWTGSADIFPMEYADILERHRVLHGTLDTAVKVDPAHLRLQLEHEAMTTLLKLRRGALAAGTDAGAKTELLDASSSTVLAVFRAMIRLEGKTPPPENLAVINAVASAAGFDGTPFARVIAHKRGEQKIPAGDAGHLLDGYLGGMQQLVHYLDRFSGRRA